MPDPNSNPAAGGAIIALAILIGAVAGVVWGQPSIGVLAGALAGSAAAIVLWLVDRRRTGR